MSLVAYCTVYTAGMLDEGYMEGCTEGVYTRTSSKEVSKERFLKTVIYGEPSHNTAEPSHNTAEPRQKRRL